MKEEDRDAWRKKIEENVQQDRRRQGFNKAIGTSFSVKRVYLLQSAIYLQKKIENMKRHQVPIYFIIAITRAITAAGSSAGAAAAAAGAE